jgi:hypothetical protein
LVQLSIRSDNWTKNHPTLVETIPFFHGQKNKKNEEINSRDALNIDLCSLQQTSISVVLYIQTRNMKN